MKRHSLFTDHVRSLIDGQEHVDDEVLGAIKSDLLPQLKNRGLTPATLEYGGKRWEGEALDNIVSDCYCHVFIGLSGTERGTDGRQRRYLEAAVLAGNSIEGLVRQKIKWFVHDHHKSKFRDDSGVYKNLCRALAILTEEKRENLLALNNEGGKIQGDSLFGRDGSSSSERVGTDDLIKFIVASDDWQPAIRIVARFSESATESAKLGIVATADAEKIPFLLDDLKSAVTDQVVERSAENSGTDADWEHSDEGSTLIRTIENENRYEHVETRDQLIALVYDAIDQYKANKKNAKSMRNRLRLVFSTQVEMRSESGANEKVKQVQLREKLNMARSTLSDLMKILKKIEDPIVEKFMTEINKT